jgi:hypothetical protein
MIQTVLAANVHNNYRKEQQARFKKHFDAQI